MARSLPLGVVMCLAATWIGCSRGPSRVKAPDIDPSDAAIQAIELYDANGDGNLNKAELSKCPGMLGELANYDKDGNQSISGDEISGRLTNLLKYGVGLTSLKCEVRVNGRPLKDAEVVFEPEPYLGDEVKAVGHRSQDETERRMKAARIVVGDKTYDVYPDRVPSN